MARGRKPPPGKNLEPLSREKQLEMIEKLKRSLNPVYPEKVQTIPLKGINRKSKRVKKKW